MPGVHAFADAAGPLYVWVDSGVQNLRGALSQILNLLACLWTILIWIPRPLVAFQI